MPGYGWFEPTVSAKRAQEAHTKYMEALTKEEPQNGDNVAAGGTKYDSGKPRFALVLGGFAKALWYVVLVGTFGAKKYSPNGWMVVPNGEERYMDALYRHWNAFLGGEEYDPESGLPHLAHMAWGVLAVMEYRYGNIQGRSDANSS